MKARLRVERAPWPSVRPEGSRAPGQALTEFALVLPILCLIFIGCLDIGRAYHTHVALSNAARVGIIYAQQADLTGLPSCNSSTPSTGGAGFIQVCDIKDQIRNEVQGGIDPSQLQIYVCLEDPAPISCSAADAANDTKTVSSDQSVVITVSTPFQTITPFVHLSRISSTVSGRIFEVTQHA